ncbi:MAG TPA: AraC family transcriptional regulator [Acetobacteraceae bacterium]|jgi:AraC family transcriptional regulator
MNPVAKALWFIEAHLGDDASLAEIADSSGVSRYQLLRAFGTATGRSVMRYVRARRLSEAARALAAGAPDILTVALDAGYGSHEAFTRAFRDMFCLTPEAVREHGALDKLQLVEPIRMDASLIVKLEPPRFESGRTLLIAGLGEHYTFETNQGIPLLWQRFVPYIGNIPGQAGDVTYGVCCNADGAGNFEYIAGVEVASFDDIPEELRRTRIPEYRYVVFTHRDHISAIRGTWYTIMNKWLPESGYEIADAPDFEHYDADFDPQKGTGKVEIWLPLKA